MRNDGKDTVRVALIGNPNVGKSTLFNALTHNNRHTGNWAGKTVDMGEGHCTYQTTEILLQDLPGTYSLDALSAEEAEACRCLFSEEIDCVAVVCDACCLARNLYLVRQIQTRVSRPLVVCVNLLDEARKKSIKVDTALLSLKLGVPVVGTSARSGKGIREFLKVCVETAHNPKTVTVPTPDASPKEIAAAVVTVPPNAHRRDRAIDGFVTGKKTSYVCMILFLCGILWLTLYGANRISDALGVFLFSLETPFASVLSWLGLPLTVVNALSAGAYRTLAWVVSVMLPPIAVFFPVFGLLEDAGFLPRIAFNLDKWFGKCHSCGKQALTMCVATALIRRS